MGPENDYTMASADDERFAKHFPYIVRILKDEARTAMRRAHTSSMENHTVFSYRDMTIDQVLDAINEAAIVENLNLSRDEQMTQLKTFAENFGLQKEIVDEIISRLP